MSNFLGSPHSGTYWSNSPGVSGRNYIGFLNSNSGKVHALDYYYRNYGLSVRCLLVAGN